MHFCAMAVALGLTNSTADILLFVEQGLGLSGLELCMYMVDMSVLL